MRRIERGDGPASLRACEIVAGEARVNLDPRAFSAWLLMLGCGKMPQVLDLSGVQLLAASRQKDVSADEDLDEALEALLIDGPPSAKLRLAIPLRDEVWSRLSGRVDTDRTCELREGGRLILVRPAREDPNLRASRKLGEVAARDRPPFSQLAARRTQRALNPRAMSQTTPDL